MKFRVFLIAGLVLAHLAPGAAPARAGTRTDDAACTAGNLSRTLRMFRTSRAVAPGRTFDSTGTFKPAENTHLVEKLVQKEPPVPSFEAWQHRLKTARIVEDRPLGGGVSKSRLVMFEDGTRAVFKPQLGKASDAGAEVAAFRFDRLLRLGLVPPTVIREVDGTLGSLQLYVEHAVTADVVEARHPEVSHFPTRRLNLFDFLIHTVDRHGGNYLIQLENRRRIAVDHGLTFDEDVSRVLIDEEAANWMKEGEVVARLRELTPEMLRTELGPYLQPARIDALHARIRYFLKRVGQVRAAQARAAASVH